MQSYPKENLLTMEDLPAFILRVPDEFSAVWR